MLFENFYNELIYYLQDRLNALTEKRNSSDDAIEQSVYDSASSAIIDVIVKIRLMKLRYESAYHSTMDGELINADNLHEK